VATTGALTGDVAGSAAPPILARQDQINNARELPSLSPAREPPALPLARPPARTAAAAALARSPPRLAPLAAPAAATPAAPRTPSLQFNPR